MGLSLESFFLFLPFLFCLFLFFSFSHSQSACIAVCVHLVGEVGCVSCTSALSHTHFPDLPRQIRDHPPRRAYIYFTDKTPPKWKDCLLTTKHLRSFMHTAFETCAHPLPLCPIPCFHPSANQPPVRFCKSPLSSQSCLFPSSAGIQLSPRIRRSTTRRGVIRRTIKRRNKS